MIRRIAFAGLLLLLAVGIYNCKHEIPQKPDPDPDPTPITQSDTCHLDTVYFVNDVLPIIISNCAKSGCHDAFTKEEGVQLTDYQNIINTGDVRAGRPDNSKIYKMMTESDPDKKMPPPPASITVEQINAVRIWILQGAKNNKCQNICDTTNVTFSKSVSPIIQSTCSGCHSGANPNGGVRLTNYSEIKQVVNNGKLDGAINHRAGFKPMPPGGSLETCAKAKIRIWINAGAPNN